MQVQLKVAYTLQIVGFILLVISAVFELPILWPTFGFFMLAKGTWDVVKHLISKRPQVDNSNR
ncbi:hypothetical protein D3C85_98610 [compost metagenome]